MAIILLIGRDEKDRHDYAWFIEACRRELLVYNPQLDIRIWPDVGNVNDIELALVWRHPLNSFNQLPQLKCIGSLAAGVDHLMIDPALPKHIPILRVIDPYMANDITQYVVANVLNCVKRMDFWAEKQKEKRWAKEPPFSLSDKTIGIMGLGFLGKHAIKALQNLALNVIGWSNSQKNLPNLTEYVGETEFKTFLSRSDILVCMLPLTPLTRNIMNHITFSLLPQGAYFINVGRGDHVVDEDLLAALATGQLQGACLDVFRQEPLPADHPFWLHPNIRITPHIASVTNTTAIPQLMMSFSRLMAGEDVANKVDVEKGY